MLIDFSKKEIKNHYSEICIIGSGIGGGTIAKKLYDNNINFVIVEAGGLSGNSKNVSYDTTGKEFGVRSTTTIQLGGTSNLWHGVLSELDKIDFEKRDWIPNSGWPITYNDIQPYYKEASDLLKIEYYNYFDATKLSPQLNNYLNDLPINSRYLKNKLFQQPLPVTNFKNIINEICQNSDKYNCYYNAPVLELIITDNSVKKIRIGKDDGSFDYIESNIFILCSGALETPRLLLNSNIKNSNIGRYLMDHPMGNLCQVEFVKPQKAPIYSDTKYSKYSKIKTGLEFQDDFQKQYKLPNHNFFLRPSFHKGINNETEKVKLSLLAFKDGGVSIKDLKVVLTNLNIIKQILVYKLSLNVIFKYADLFFVTEQIPNWNSYVSLSHKKDRWDYRISKVHWQLSQQDIDSIRFIFGLLIRDVFSKEMFRFINSETDFFWENICTSAIHHVGTARMAINKQEGVVDKDLKVFGLNNLYICDGSIFPTSGNVNNGLSISAFACRLVSHIINFL